MRHKIDYNRNSVIYLFLFMLLCGNNFCKAQSPGNTSSLSTRHSIQSFNSDKAFIENIGQYGKSISEFERLGTIKYGYEGLGMPVLFTTNGIIHLQRKIKHISHEEEERLEKQGVSEEEIESKRIVSDRVITMEWVDANQNAEIIEENKTTDYHTYGNLSEKAFGFKRITYKNIYPGIDVVYSFDQSDRTGFEYSLVVRPGADLSVVKLRYGGDVKGIKLKSNGILVIRSDIEKIESSFPISYYNDNLNAVNKELLKSVYKINGNEISFSFPKDYDHSRIFIIDPFITATGNLTGINAGKAKDVDFDYAGNIYVTGGGNSTVHQLAKFNAAGVLQWTFSGTLTIPTWNFGSYWGGWMVEKPTGNIYLGQGFNPNTGFQVIRISTTGLYDNYITNANPSFREAWKMLWSCNNGSPQILVAGGGTNSNINFGVFTPPSAAIGSLNVTGIPYTGTAGWAQDIVDFIIDPSNNDMYTIYGSLYGNPSLTNQVYKNTFPYSDASVAWNVPSGFVSVQEIANRPYLAGGEIDNSANIFAINASYLYYWDGKNLKAFDKATGNTVGTPLTTGNIALMQGGIVADACDNVYVGESNGNIKVYKFNGSTFNDAAAPDITIAGFNGKAVYDLAYDEAKKILYASGNGFVASFDVTAYCPTTQYTLNVAPNCVTASATVTVTPTAPAGSTITYNLYTGTTLISTNTTGIFSGLNPNISYSVVATINLSCSGTQATASFTIPGATINIVQTNTTCGNSTGAITATGSGTTGPYTYSIDGVTFQASGTFSGLTAGIYTITVKDANGCKSVKTVTILNTNGPSLTYTNTNADCGNNNGTVTASATGGLAPYQYSINGVVFQSSNFFTGLPGGTYLLTVKDANGCTNAALVTITSSPGPLITAIPAAATCGSSNGSITAFGNGGTAPLEYSVNGNIFQASTVFLNLVPGTYTVTVRDANGCIKTTSVTIPNSPAPTVAATSTPAACSNANGTITATGTGGIAPLQYSIDGSFFQTGNVFTGLAAGTYTITVKDNAGCTNIIAVTVGATGGPSVSATSTVSACNINNGSITVTASAGIAPYQYSIDGIIFQASNIFSGVGAGNYVVYVRDASGCYGTFSIVVGNTAGPSLTLTATATACNTNNGTITATGSGGTAPLQYSIDGTTYQAGNLFTGLATGQYTIYVKDANGCIKTASINIVNVSGLTLAVSTITSSCSTNNGVVTATATGGVAPLQYSINGTVYQASNIFTALAPGIYSVYVKDASNCIVTQQVTVASLSGPSIIVSSSDATCGSSNGIITANGAGGVAPLTYSINGVTFQSSGTFLNVVPGTYTVTVMDDAGCSASQIVVISSSGVGPGISTFTVVAKGAYLCNGDLGKITNPRVNGSTCNSCTYSLNGAPFIPNATQLYLNVAPGVYTVTAMDANGCTKTILVTITDAVLSTATAVVTGTSCSTSTGTITLTGIGPNTPYHASITGIGGPWVTFDPTTTFTGLAPGVYTIILSDDESFDSGPPIDPGGCLDTITVIVPSPGGPSITVFNTVGTCGLDNGTITANGSGGTAPLSYSIDGTNYQASNVFTNVAPGIYFVSVQDANGCINIKTDILASSSLPSITAITTDANCGINNGIITLTGTGGTAPLQYSINGTSFQSSNIFTNLSAGNYTLYVADASECYGTLSVTLFNAPLPKVTAFTIAATCNDNNGSIITTGSLGVPPYTFSINGTVYQSSDIFSNLAAGFYTVYINDANGCITHTGLSVGNLGAPVITNTVSTPASCGNATGSIVITANSGTAPLQYSINGTTFQAGNVFPGLIAGTYTITVKDANGCLATKTVLVGNTNGPQVLTAAVVHAACGLNNGSIIATASGGTAPLQYSIDGITYQAGAFFNGLAANSYTLYVKDANGCIKTLLVNVVNLPSPTLTTTTSPASCGLNDGTITANVSGGTGIITYSKDGITFQASNIFLGLAAGTYIITVKDARGCLATSTITVTTIGAVVTPTFTPVAAICSGAVLSALPTTSLNGINGTWSPAINNTATTTYSFTPTAGLCATTTTLTVIVNPTVTPTFNPVAALCSGSVAPVLPTTSNNGITGTWNPATVNNTVSASYTFTPTAGQCAVQTSITITVTSNTVPTFNPVAAICSGSALAALPTTSLNGINGSWAPALNNIATTTYTFTPTAGQCATTTTLTITVNANVTPAFTPVAAICSVTVLAALPTTSLNGINGTWAPALNNTATTTYTFTPTAGQCATTTTLTITVNPNITPTFTPIAAICSGTVLAALPTTSLNGVNGSWAPALNNTTTTTYTFTPTAGQCATTTTLSITINPNITPTFNPVAAICSSTVLSALPTTSLNGVNGSWTPALNNTATTTYTFTPTAGQCATTTTLSITVNANVTPTFTPVAAICSGTVLAALPTTSLNGINGTWAPALNNTATTTYTFTPTAGQCATTTTLSITVNANVTPTFTPVAAICSGSVLTALPTTSLNGINGSWAPALNNTATTTYTFTPTVGQCATTTTLTITVNPNVTPTFTPVAAICSGSVLTAIPTTSLNGINGTWAPALNNTATTTYTFTPTAGQCATTTTLTITVNPLITPTFNAVAAICSGDASPVLPTTSINGISGSWVPAAVNNTVSATYTFIPTAGQCAVITVLQVTVNPLITPTFNPVAAICSGAVLAALPTTSLNGIAGSWSPALNNTTTTTYTFTPNGGQCATTATLTVTVNPILSATINCGISTTSSVIFNWAAVAGATGYNISYQVGAGPLVNVGTVGNVLTYVVTGLTAGDNVTITLTPTGAAGTCFTASIATCTATACTPPTAGISYATTFCASIVTGQPVNLTGTGSFTGGSYSALPGLTLNTLTGNIIPATSIPATYLVTYTIPATAGCSIVTATTSVTIDPVIVPAFNSVAAICSGSVLAALPTISLNGITGSWSPTLNNTATTTYTFTPTAGQCANTTTLTVTVNSNVIPTFNPVAPICSGSVLAALPTTSLNGITGSWSPVLNNTATTTYTFTPTAGQCANTTTLTITVMANVIPTFSTVAAICSGSVLAALQTTSLNGITGSWTPILNNTATTTYTFTPTAGQCANTTTLTVTVNTNVIPTFSPVAAICSGSVLAALPTTSLNGITGSWTPALNNSATTTYSFTPTAGQCANTTTLTITVNPPITPTFNPVAAICSGDLLAALPTTSLNGIIGTWSPSLNNTATTTYTFTPAAGQCATTAALTVTVNPILSANINCGISTTSSVTFNWAVVTGASGYTLSYQVAANPVVNVGAVGNVLTYTVTGLTAGDIVTLTLIPTGAAGTCFAAAAATCTATACNPPTANISYATPFCASVATAQNVTLTGTGTFTGGTYSSPLGLTLNPATGEIIPLTSIPATYIVTYTIPASAGCSIVTATTSVTIDASITATFNPVASICSGDVLTALPTTSLNGMTGTWTPGLNNTVTTTYTFTPTAGQCAATTTLTIIVNPLITPTFNPVAAICSGDALSALPITSLNGINGSWSPLLNNTATTTYTFTPTAGQCATTATLTVTVNPLLSATINCGISTSSSVTFNWAAVPGATGYTLSYQVGVNPVINAGAIGNVLTYAVTALAAGDIVAITLTPTGGAGTCFIASTATCTANACNPPTAAISYSTPVCVLVATAQHVTLTGTGAYTGGTFSSAPGLSINASTGDITPSTSTPFIYTVTYTIPATSGCAIVTATTSVTIAALTIPTFNAIAPTCTGSVLAPLPAISLNGITGSWSPALNNSTTTTYTFTPTAGQCANATTKTITIDPLVTPAFNPLAAICAGGALAALPTTSLNGITGSWLPALNNTTTTTYTFTPTAGQCAGTATLTITVNPLINPAFNPVAAICAGDALAALPTTSLNGITGSWSPALNNTTTTTYSFTATAGQCAGTATLTVTVNPLINPAFNPVAAICAGDALAALPTISLNGITGSWSPALNNTTTTTYTFTATAGQCAGTATLTITVNPLINPAFNPVAAICAGDALAALPTTSLNGITGSWSPALNNTATTTYTFTATAGQCASTTTLTITVNTNSTVPTFTAIGPLCQGSTAPSLPASSNNGITGSWNPATINTTAVGTNTYTFTTAAGQCATASTTLDITIVNQLTPTFTAIGPLCQNSLAPSMPATSNNGFTGNWNPATINTTAVGISTYTFTPDAGQCATTTFITLTISSVPAAPTVNVIQPTCIITTGTLTVTSATAGLTFSLDGAAYNSYPAGGYTLLAAGLHTISAQTAAGCRSAVTSITINAQPAPPTAIATTITNTSCGNANGILQLGAVTGGTPAYSYSVDGSAFTSTLTYNNLAGGPHSIVVKDANGCTYSKTINITNSSGPTVTAIPVNASCGAGNGTITATGTGGAAAYQYSINGTTFQAGNIFTGLAANTYTVTIKDANNCINTTTVIVSTNNPVTVDAGNPATICEGDDVQLSPTSNAANFLWTPPAGLSNATIINPIASPAVTTTYTLTASTGPCSAIGMVTVFVNPAPVPHTGVYPPVCFGGNVQLSATGGLAYQWTPSTYLSNPNIANPVVTSAPTGTYTYLINVTDVNGCHALINAAAVITILPPVIVFAGNDTSIAINQPLHLNAIDVNNAGITAWLWSPSAGLNNAFIHNPAAVIDHDMIYTVTATTITGCTGTDEIKITVFRGPEIYVPTAFTPNGDGTNDLLKPILIGIRSLSYFSVFNRYGEQVYSTSTIGAGWNGFYKGQIQNTAGYVWVAEAVDYKGHIIQRKGNAVLIR